MSNFSAADHGFYEPIGENVYRPTRHVQGAWRDDEQHMAPVAGLLVAAMEAHDARDEMQTVRVALDICGVMAADDTHVHTSTLRPGRTIELLEVDATIDDRVAVRGRAWRVAKAEVAEISGVEFTDIPGPDACEASGSFLKEWPGGFIEQIEVRQHIDNRPGRGIVWLRSPHPVFTTGPASPLAEFLRLADAANGSVPRANPRAWMFPNVDWTAHVFRQPDPEWLGLEVTQSIDANGVGLTSSTLHDVHGPVGKLEQILTVRPMPKKG